MRISDWSSDVCSPDLTKDVGAMAARSRAYQGAGAAGTMQVKRNGDRAGPATISFSPGASSARKLSARAPICRPLTIDRKSVAQGKRVSVRVVLGGRRIIHKTNNQNIQQHTKNT